MASGTRANCGVGPRGGGRLGGLGVLGVGGCEYPRELKWEEIEATAKSRGMNGGMVRGQETRTSGRLRRHHHELLKACLGPPHISFAWQGTQCPLAARRRGDGGERGELICSGGAGSNFSETTQAATGAVSTFTDSGCLGAQGMASGYCCSRPPLTAIDRHRVRDARCSIDSACTFIFSGKNCTRYFAYTAVAAVVTSKGIQGKAVHPQHLICTNRVV